MTYVKTTNDPPANERPANDPLARISGPYPRQWVERYAGYLYSYTFVQLDHEEQARDPVQETFLSALEKGRPVSAQ